MSSSTSVLLPSQYQPGVSRPNQRSRLRVTAPTGVEADLQQVLEAEQAKTGNRFLFRIKQPRLRSLALKRVSRTGIRILVALGIFVSLLFAVDFQGSPGSGNAVVGTSRVASAEVDCKITKDSIDLPGPDDAWGFSTIEEWIVNGVNLFCNVLNFTIEGLQEAVLKPVKNAIWKGLHPNRFCGDRTPLVVENPSSGFNGMMTQLGDALGSEAQKQGNNPKTTWEAYSTAGVSWRSYFLDCLDSRGFTNGGANVVLSISQIFAVIAIVAFEQTFRSQIVNYFLAETNGMSAMDLMIKRLNADIFMEFIAIAVVIAAAVLFWRAMIKGAGLADFLSKLGIMVFIAGFAFAFPSIGPGLLKDTNEFINQSGETVMKAFVGEHCPDYIRDAGGIGPLPNYDTNPPDGYQCAAQAMYDTLVINPWVMGVSGGDLQNKDVQRNAATVLAFQAYTRAERNTIEAASSDQRGRLEDEMRQKRWQARFDFVTKDPPNGIGASFAERKEDGEDAAPFAETGEHDWRPYSHVIAKDQQTWELWSGGKADSRFGLAIMALVGAIALGAVLTSITIAYLTLQLVTVGLGAVAPLVFLIALIPGIGLNILMGWLQTLVASFVKRIALILFVVVLLSGFRLIYLLITVFWLRILLMVGMALVGMAYRKKFTDWASMGMGKAGQAADMMSNPIVGAQGLLQKGKKKKNAWQSARQQGLSRGDAMKVMAASEGGAQGPQSYQASKIGSKTPNGVGTGKGSRKGTNAGAHPRQPGPGRRTTQPTVGPRGRTNSVHVPGNQRGNVGSPAGTRSGRVAASGVNRTGQAPPPRSTPPPSSTRSSTSGASGVARGNATVSNNPPTPPPRGSRPTNGGGGGGQP